MREWILEFIEAVFKVLAFCSVIYVLCVSVVGIAWLMGVFA